MLPTNDTLAPELERELFGLVRRERFARDTADWDGMQRAYWPDSIVRVTWFEGTAAEFIEMSRERRTRGSGMHLIWPTRALVGGDRALIESRGQILIRPRMHDVECDVTSWCRFFSRAERRGGEWRLTSFDSIYGKDRVDPVLPGASLALDIDALATFRSSYRYLTYLNIQAGYQVPQNLPGDDRPESVDAFYADAVDWLNADAVSATGDHGLTRSMS